MKDMRARAKVTVQVEVYSDSVWGKDCKIEQVYKQACDDVMFTLNKALGKDPKVRICNNPKIDVIILEE